VIAIELILVLIFVGVCFTVYRLTKLLEIGNKILDELKLARPKRETQARIGEDPLPPPLRLTQADIEQTTSKR
jgi:hypothetical protein